MRLAAADRTAPSRPPRRIVPAHKRIICARSPARLTQMPATRIRRSAGLAPDPVHHGEGKAIPIWQVCVNPCIKEQARVLITQCTDSSFVPPPSGRRRRGVIYGPRVFEGPRTGRSGSCRLASRWAHLLGQRGPGADHPPSSSLLRTTRRGIAARKTGRCRGARSGTIARLVARNGNK